MLAHQKYILRIRLISSEISWQNQRSLCCDKIEFSTKLLVRLRLWLREIFALRTFNSLNNCDLKPWMLRHWNIECIDLYVEPVKIFSSQWMLNIWLIYIECWIYVECWIYGEYWIYGEWKWKPGTSLSFFPAGGEVIMGSLVVVVVTSSSSSSSHCCQQSRSLGRAK